MVVGPIRRRALVFSNSRGARGPSHSSTADGYHSELIEQPATFCYSASAPSKQDNKLKKHFERVENAD